MLVGHKEKIKYLDDSVKNDRLSHAYLFVGPESVGKTIIAKNFAISLLGKNGKDKESDKRFLVCNAIESGFKPDLLVYDDNDQINVEKVRDLIHFLNLKPYQSAMKVTVIAHADRMTPSAANAFLKTLEEPAPKTIIILTAESLETLPQTIISRTQVIRFGFVKSNDIKELLTKEANIDESKAKEIIDFSAGKPGLALRLALDLEQTVEIKQLLKKVTSALATSRVSNRLTLAEELAEEKDSIVKKFGYIESYFQQKLHHKNLNVTESLKIVAFLDKMAQSRKYIKSNVNTRLALEALLLTGAKN